jgi:anti-sigma factor RsiW
MRLFKRKRVPEHLPCRDVVEIVTAYLDDELDDQLRQRLEYHLTLCDPCVEYIEQVRRTIAISGESIPPEQLPPELRDGLRLAFADWAHGH